MERVVAVGRSGGGVQWRWLIGADRVAHSSRGGCRVVPCRVVPCRVGEVGARCGDWVSATTCAAIRKRAKYPMCAILPSVLEHHGRFGDDAFSFLKRIAPKEPAARSEPMVKLY